MTDTAIASAQYIVPGAPSKEPAHNDALERLEQLAQITVVNRTTTSAPSSPAQGAAYIVASVPTGVWSAQTHRVAAYYSGWTFLDPREGWKAYDQNTDQGLVFDGSVWQLDRAERFLGGPNVIINGNFDIWQRGTSFTVNGYTADRWRLSIGTGGSPAATVTRQTHTLGQTDVPGEPRYYLRHDQTAAATTPPAVVQRIESVRTFAGEEVTVSVWLKASKTLTLTGFRLRQVFGTGGSPSSTVNHDSGALSLTTLWKQFSFTTTLPSISGKTIGSNEDDYLELQIRLTINDTYQVDVSEEQLELGPAATEFQRRPFAAELALCQRLTWVVDVAQTGDIFGGAKAHSATAANAYVPFPVTMRADPVLTISAAGDFNVVKQGGGTQAVTALSLSRATEEGSRLAITVSTGLVAGNATELLAANTNAILTFDAEL